MSDFELDNEDQIYDDNCASADDLDDDDDFENSEEIEVKTTQLVKEEDSIIKVILYNILYEHFLYFNITFICKYN